jgi:hypothetical protein
VVAVWFRALHSQTTATATEASGFLFNLTFTVEGRWTGQVSLLGRTARVGPHAEAWQAAVELEWQLARWCAHTGIARSHYVSNAARLLELGFVDAEGVVSDIVIAVPWALSKWKSAGQALNGKYKSTAAYALAAASRPAAHAAVGPGSAAAGGAGGSAGGALLLSPTPTAAAAAAAAAADAEAAPDTVADVLADVLAASVSVPAAVRVGVTTRTGAGGCIVRPAQKAALTAVSRERRFRRRRFRADAVWYVDEGWIDNGGVRVAVPEGITPETAVAGPAPTAHHHHHHDGGGDIDSGSDSEGSFAMLWDSTDSEGGGGGGGGGKVGRKRARNARAASTRAAQLRTRARATRKVEPHGGAGEGDGGLGGAW